MWKCVIHINHHRLIATVVPFHRVKNGSLVYACLDLFVIRIFHQGYIFISHVALIIIFFTMLPKPISVPLDPLLLTWINFDLSMGK